MSMKLYRSKRLWLDVELHWSVFIVGIEVDRDYDYCNDRKTTCLYLYLGPIAISILL